jgi:hypothetical protein
MFSVTDFRHSLLWDFAIVSGIVVRVESFRLSVAIQRIWTSRGFCDSLEQLKVSESQWPVFIAVLMSQRLLCEISIFENSMESFECSHLLGGFSRIVINNGVHSFFKSIAFLEPVESVGIDFQGWAHACKLCATQGDVGVQTQSGFWQQNGESIQQIWKEQVTL